SWQAAAWRSTHRARDWIRRTCSGSTPPTRRSSPDLRAAGPRSGLEGPGDRAPLEGDAQRAAVLLAGAAVRLSVRARARPRAPGLGAARPALARLHPEWRARVGARLPRRARERLLGSAAARTRHSG